MQTTKHRTSFALDEATVERLRRLARRWDVSQAEVVRRAVKLAEDHDEKNSESVRERLRGYQEDGNLTADSAGQYLKQVAKDRERWDRAR
ncbi:MAG: ribbon-helix-helix protein, CopG family [Spirochaetaceae bacterium]